MIKLHEFKQLKVGTVLEWYDGWSLQFEVKTSRDCATIVYDDKDADYYGDVINYKKYSRDLEFVSIADESIQNILGSKDK